MHGQTVMNFKPPWEVKPNSNTYVLLIPVTQPYRCISLSQIVNWPCLPLIQVQVWIRRSIPRLPTRVITIIAVLGRWALSPVVHKNSGNIDNKSSTFSWPGTINVKIVWPIAWNKMKINPILGLGCTIPHIATTMVTYLPIVGSTWKGWRGISLRIYNCLLYWCQCDTKQWLCGWEKHTCHLLIYIGIIVTISSLQRIPPVTSFICHKGTCPRLGMVPMTEQEIIKFLILMSLIWSNFTFTN